ncbi:hypothetical protein CBR_g52397 [Chara braunii]|uniref:plastoquinol--plastocyanin reductase n=1 Tax=Chara braunii TaxID=69332 RepID=A0A388MAF4_CHABU|nr:hypothetical protein CBR_g52397 [Chara braunii]|eukprot:GBG91442.1 hypothetical protein CBR_g52397 [Chara braunii]
MAAATAAQLSSAASVAALSTTKAGKVGFSSSNGILSSTKGLGLAPPLSPVHKLRLGKTVCQAAAAGGRVPDMGKRVLMNWLLAGAVSLPVAGMAGPYLYFFVPQGSGGAGGGVTAKDELGNDVIASKWVKAHSSGDRSLAQGLKGDPTYIVVEDQGQIATFGINAVCTHLGCVVPWNKAENKFICPCHGSQYNNQGKVVRGPAPLSLALAHTDIVDDKVILTPWTETDFRTGGDPWWS